jgi:hypothetical protein
MFVIFCWSSVLFLLNSNDFLLKNLIQWTRIGFIDNSLSSLVVAPSNWIVICWSSFLVLRTLVMISEVVHISSFPNAVGSAALALSAIRECCY